MINLKSSNDRTDIQRKFDQVYDKKRPKRIIDLTELPDLPNVFGVLETTESGREKVNRSTANADISEFAVMLKEATETNDFPGLQTLAKSLLAKFPGSSSAGAFHILAKQSEQLPEIKELLRLAQNKCACMPEFPALFKQVLSDLSS